MRKFFKLDEHNNRQEIDIEDLKIGDKIQIVDNPIDGKFDRKDLNDIDNGIVRIVTGNPMDDGHGNVTIGCEISRGAE